MCKALTIKLIFQFLFAVFFTSSFCWGVISYPWLLCVFLSFLGFAGLKKHMMLLLLMLEFFSLFLIFVTYSLGEVDAGSVMILMLLFTSLASEGAVSLALFLASTRASSQELTSLNI